MSYTGRVHRVQIGALHRDLPLFQLAPNFAIAIFNMLGDTEIVEAAAQQLTKLLPPEAEVLVVPEVKAIPLGHSMSVHSGLPLVVVRKLRKPYMANSIEVEVVTITTGVPQTLFLDGRDVDRVAGKRAVLVDDVISTGSTLTGLNALMAEANACIVGEMAVFTEGKNGDWPNIIALGHLPIFTD